MLYVVRNIMLMCPNFSRRGPHGESWAMSLLITIKSHSPVNITPNGNNDAGPWTVETEHFYKEKFLDHINGSLTSSHFDFFWQFICVRGHSDVD